MKFHHSATSLLLVSALTYLSSCATKPEAVPPSYVSHMGYMDFNCKQLGQEQARLIAALSSASDAQRRARSNDTVGVIFLGLPVSSLSGSNQASNIGRLKGELEAIQKAMVAKGCESEIIDINDVVAGNVGVENNNTPKSQNKIQKKVISRETVKPTATYEDKKKQLLDMYLQKEITKEEYFELRKELDKTK
jgi:hypothetical protein